MTNQEKASPRRKNGLPAESLAFRLAGAARAVSLVENGQSLPAALSAVFSRSGADAAASGAIQDTAYRTMRNLGLLRYLVRSLTRKPPEPPLLNSLLLCALSLLLPDGDTLRYESHTAVDQAVRAAAAIPSLARAKNLVNAVLRRFLREKETLLAEAQSDSEARWNYPVWWSRKLRAAYPEKWQDILAAGNLKPPLTLRINRRKTSVDGYIKSAEKAGMQARAAGPFAVILSDPVPAWKIPGFKEGFVSVQDASAQLAAPLLQLEDGMRVLDACSAPGGKSGHMLELANIDLLALDSDPERLKMVQENLLRLDLSAELKAGDAAETSWWDGNFFDCILADVPCTASGIIRRHPDIRWLRRPEDPAELAALSARILENLWSMLKPGGKLLFATCSVWPEESARQAEVFAEKTGALRLGAPGQILPSCSPDAQGDGLFYALFKKR